MHQILVVFEHSNRCVETAKHVSDLVAAGGNTCSLLDLRYAESIDLRVQDAVLVVAPVSRARQRASVARFVRPRAARLSTMPGAFVSVGPDAPEKHEGVVRALLGRAGWSPTVIAQLEAERRRGRVARAARSFFETLSRPFVARAPSFHAEPRLDWRPVDDALDRVLEVADEAFVTPAARSHRTQSPHLRPM